MNSPGVYKFFSSNLEEADIYYSGCTDSMFVKDSSVIINESISRSVNSYLAEVLRNSQYKVFSDLLSIEASRVDSNSNLLMNCYDLNNLDDELIYKISSLYGINYPLDYDTSKLLLLFKNYEKIRKRRGDLESIYMLLRLIDRSESDLYEDDSDDTRVVKIANGYYEITNSRITSTEFAKYMLGKVIRSGIYFTFNGI